MEEGREYDRRKDFNNEGYGVRELTSKVLQIQAKKFFLDVKENRRGRFIKISEVGTTGHKNRLLIDMNTASDFHEQLTNFIEHYASLGPRSRDNYGDDKIKSEVIYAGERRYYLDLKENSRGRFLKVAMTMPPPSADRQQVVIPAQGMIDVRDALTDILSEFGVSYSFEEVKQKLSLEADNKVFFFDVGENQYGDYLRISEVSPSFRTAISIPQNIWPQFREKLHAVGATLVKADCQPKSADVDVQNDCSANLHPDAAVGFDKPASPTAGTFSYCSI